MQPWILKTLRYLEQVASDAQLESEFAAVKLNDAEARDREARNHSHAATTALDSFKKLFGLYNVGGQQ